MRQIKLKLYREVIVLVFSYNELRKQYKSNDKIKQMILDKKIFKIEKGIYSDNNNVNYLEVLIKKYPNAIFAMDSAFYYHNLTDVIPEREWLVLRRNSTKIRN